MLEADLIAHQRSARETRSRLEGDAEIASGRSSVTRTISERGPLRLVSGTRQERNVATGRARDILNNIKAEAEEWIEKAFLSPGALVVEEAKEALTSLTTAFLEIRRSVPSLEPLRSEVAGTLDTFEAVLGELEENVGISRQTAPLRPVVHESCESSVTFL